MKKTCCASLLIRTTLQLRRPPPPLLHHLRLGPLPQNPLQNLPTSILRNGFYKFHTAFQSLVINQFLAHILLHILFAWDLGCGIPALDVCAGEFVALANGIGDADDCCVDDLRVGEEEAFEFGGCDLEAADFDESGGGGWFSLVIYFSFVFLSWARRAAEKGGREGKGGRVRTLSFGLRCRRGLFCRLCRLYRPCGRSFRNPSRGRWLRGFRSSLLLLLGCA